LTFRTGTYQCVEKSEHKADGRLNQ